MKHIKRINELFGNLFHKDEKTAEGILKELKNINYIHITTEGEANRPGCKKYSLTLDGFDIEIKCIFSLRSGTNRYYLQIDNVGLDCSDSVMIKIYNRILEIYNREEIEMREYTKKDAKIHFSKK